MSRQDWDIEAFKIQARFARVMGHPIRLRILFLLEKDGPVLASSDLIDDLEISKASLSQHLTKMASVGLIRTIRVGRFLHLRLANPAIGKACLLVREALLSQSQEQKAILEASALEPRKSRVGDGTDPDDSSHP